MKITYLLMCGLASALLLACNPKPSTSSQNDTTQIAKERIDTVLTNNTAQNDFATKAAIGGMMEVESSAKMIKFTENRDIQTLATMMVKDHGAANSELKELARREELYLPQVLPADKLEKLKQLSDLQEEEANRFYAELMVKEHQEAVALFTAASQNETNPKLKEFAMKHLPTLKAHASHAVSVNKIMQSIKNDKGDLPIKISKDRAN